VSIRANVDRARLNERVTVWRKTLAQDAVTGADEETWASLVVCWAAVDGVPAREARAADALQSIQDYTVWIRADILTRFAITQNDRITWRGKTLDIQGIPDQQLRGRLIAIIARAGVNDG
jgi:SPP1 family predicted phage head-tail adaptor